MATVVVTLGTDHHPFDRLVEWVERWAAERGTTDVFVQHGYTRPARIGAGTVLAPREEMLEHYKAASVVITQGGPGGIFDVASVGKAPIVVPRRPDLGEHVDGHQIAFSRYISSRGAAILAEDYETFAAQLDAGVAEPLRLAREPRASPVEQTAAELERVIEDVLSRPAGFVRWSRFFRVRPAAGMTLEAPTAVPVGSPRGRHVARPAAKVRSGRVLAPVGGRHKAAAG